MDSDPIAEIKARLDIAEYVGGYVTLKKAGINLMGLCPFHDERTPSFTVSPERQTFKCFGCGKGGDILSFAMEREGVDFPTALRLLADKAGVVLPERTAASKQIHDERSRLLLLNEKLAGFWHTIFNGHSKAAAAREYILKKRQVPQPLVDAFMIGIAPAQSTTLAFLKKQGFSTAEMKAAGDPARFAGRITFPIGDITGRVVGFTGRLLPSAESGVRGPSGPKYWNTPETAAFKKSQTLYGLHIAKETIRKTGVVLLAEGQLDVIGLHAAGLTNAVASSGTALTPQHISVIKRFANELVFAYDADSAGQAATQKGFSLALAADLTPTVLALPPGEDPGSLAVKNPTELKRLYEARQPIIRWLLSNAISANSTATPSGKRAISKVVLPWIGQIPDAVERRAWVDVVAEEIKISPSALDEELRKLNSHDLPEITQAASSSPVTTLSLLIGLVGLHPTLATRYRHTLQKLTHNTPYENVITFITAAESARVALDRPAELALQDAITIAEREYGQLTLPEFSTALDTCISRAVTEHNHRITTALKEQIDEAEAASDFTRLNSLLERLRSDTLKEPYE